MTLDDPGDLYVQMGGTSTAALRVTGAIALLFEARGPGLTVADARQIMLSLADAAGMVVPHSGYGWGRLRLTDASAWVAEGPDVWVKTAADDTGLTHDNPEHGQENHVQVMVRNRGTGIAYNTQVHLYWADPATNIPVGQWRTDGIRVGTAQTNVQVIPELPPGAARQTPVPFSWFPPPLDSGISADGHFCLLARLENDIDPSGAGIGGWNCVRDRNNIGLKNVWVVDLLPDDTTADVAFYIEGGVGANALWLDGRDLPDGVWLTL